MTVDHFFCNTELGDGLATLSTRTTMRLKHEIPLLFEVNEQFTHLSKLLGVGTLPLHTYSLLIQTKAASGGGTYKIGS